MISKINIIRLYFDTLKYLKIKQVWYQGYYRIKKIYTTTPVPEEPSLIPQPAQLKLEPSIPSCKSYFGNGFVFLNKERSFSDKIDWNFSDYGKLWAYNLNYFDFLNQESIERKDALELISSFCKSPSNLKVGAEPYPISIRGINWIKFFIYQKIDDPHYNAILFSHYRFLAANLEYHLMGNHLLENGFSLLFGAYYFREEAFYKTAYRILLNELEEQVLKDGAHFELSPMYHQILLFRLLDSINLVMHNLWKNDDLLNLLVQKASLMVSWLKSITFSNGDVPMVNDSAYGIAPTSDSLFKYTENLGIRSEASNLSDSGYRMIKSNGFELFIDVGNIGPDYIPGHAHSDTFSFLLYCKGNPIIVDTGVSTYEKGQKRHIERSTLSHNTVLVSEQEQSEVWAGFRVGRRAKIIGLKENYNEIQASHDGYKFIGLTHTRIWQWNDNEVSITDEVSGKSYNSKCLAFLHFHPNVDISIDEKIIYAGSLSIKFHGQPDLKLEDYDFASGFNKTTKGKVLKIQFSNSLKMSIRF